MPAGLPSAILVEVEFTAGVWTDVASSVVGDSIEIRVGRESAASDSQPGTLSLTLDNADGQWTPDNPTSSRYPNWTEGKRIRVRVTKSATTYVRFVGRITSIVPDFPQEPSQSRVQVQAVDLLGDLASQEIANTASAYFIRRAELGSANAYYPLDDNGVAVAPFGAAAFEARGSKMPLTVRSVSTGGAVEWRGDDFLGMPAVKLTAGKGLSGGSVSLSVGQAYALVITVFVQENSYGEVVALTTGPRASATDGMLIRWASTGFVIDDYAGGVVVTSTTIAADPGWHVLAIDGNVGGTNNFYVDSSLVTGVADTSVTGYTVASVGGNLNMSACLFAYGAQTNPVRAFSAPDTVGFFEIVGAGTTSLFDVLTDLADLGGQSAIAGPLDTNTVNPSPILDVDTNGLDVALRLARSIGGIVYQVYSTAATQSLRFEGTGSQRPTTVALTIDAELDAQGGPTFARDVVQKAQAATASSPTTSVTYVDSTQTSGGSPSDIETYINEPEALNAVAQDVVARSAANRLRVSQVTVDLSLASNDLYAAFYALTPGERVRVSNLPSTYFGVTYMEGYAEGWTERPGVTGYEVTFDLSPADAPPEGLWDDSTYGRWGFGDGVATNVSSATSSATSVQFQWTGGLTLSTSAGDYPLDLDWNGERITVTSAPAGGSSPQTLTITRGVAPTVARAHNAGERVDIWNAARWAM